MRDVDVPDEKFGELTRTESSIHKKIGSLIFRTKWTKHEAEKRCHNGTDDSFKSKIDESNNQLSD